MKNIETYRKMVLMIIVALVITKIILSLFFYREVMFRSTIPLILDSLVLFFLVVFGYIKYRADEKIVAASPAQFLILTVVGLLVYIVVTTKTHRRQIDVLTKLIETSKSK